MSLQKKILFIGLGALLGWLMIHWGFTQSFELYNHPHWAGHDFSLTAISLLEGNEWILSNGFWSALFNPPWFTPGLCGGVPFFADPQSIYYSLPQWLSWWVGPIESAYYSLWFYEMLLYFGCVGTMVVVFKRPWYEGVLAGWVGMAQTFLPLKTAVGELGYLSWAWWPTIVGLLLWENKGASWRKECVVITFLSLIGTSALYAGFGASILPALLGIFLWIGILSFFWPVKSYVIVKRVMGSGVLMVGLNGPKLVVSLSFLNHFPRNFYEPFHFNDFSNVFIAWVNAWVSPSEWTSLWATPLLKGARFQVLPHEWAFNWGVGAIVCAMIGVTMVLWRSRFEWNSGQSFKKYKETLVGLWQKQSRKQKVRWGLKVMGLMMMAMIPWVALYVEIKPESTFKRIPILSTQLWSMRWMLIHVPLIHTMITLGCLLTFKMIRSVWGRGLLIVLFWSGTLLEPMGYYTGKGMWAEWNTYRPEMTLTMFKKQREGVSTPVTKITDHQSMVNPQQVNDDLTKGYSQRYCYYPIFGYQQENLPNKDHHFISDPLGKRVQDQTVLNNPSCLIFSQDNQCQPGEGFKPHQENESRLFLERKPWSWEQPRWMILVKIVALVLWIVVVGVVLLSTMMLIRRLKKS